MKRGLWLTALALSIGLFSTARAAEDYIIHVVEPLTGGAAFVGKGQQEMMEILAEDTNKHGGIAGRPLKLVFHDDQTSPQVAVQLANEILASHPAVIMGSSITAMCNAMAPLVKNGPVMYCLSPGARPAPGDYVFSATVPTNGLYEAMLRYFRLNGWTRLAMLSSSDATGQDADRAFAFALGLPENADIKVVEYLHFTTTDVSVTAQIERIKASGAQAMVAWTTGAQLVTILKGVVQSGLDMPIATSAGNQLFEPFAQFVPFLPKMLLMPSAAYPEHDGIARLDPRVEKVQHDMYALLAAKGLKADNSIGTAWDPLLIVISALRKFGPDATAAQIHNYIMNLTDFAGVDGIYDFKKVPQRGLDASDCVMVRYDPVEKRWAWMSEPGGVPFKK